MALGARIGPRVYFGLWSISSMAGPVEAEPGLAQTRGRGW